MNHETFLAVIKLMQTVGQHLLDWRDDSKAYQVHSRKGFKTEADQRAHRLICHELLRLSPNIPVLSEEDQFHSKHRPNHYWLIDPIDGTASWHEGFDGFVTQAALMQGGTPVFGVVHAPALAKTWTAALGKGAFLNGDLLPPLIPRKGIILTDNYSSPRHAAAVLSARLPVTDYVESGSLGLKCCLVADGTADLFVKDVVVRDWDIAPAASILAEVGAVLSLPDGSNYEFSGPMEKKLGILIARNAHLASDAVDILSHSYVAE